MQRESLPKHVDVLKLCDQGADWQIALDLSGFQRLRDALTADPAPAQLDIKFDKDDYGNRLIHGTIAASLALECQRCGEPVEISLESELALMPVLSESQCQSVPAEYEPLITNAEPVDLAEALEDELLLALPMVAKHDNTDCNLEEKIDGSTKKS